MPKLKTHKGAAKRFKKTGTGKNSPRSNQEASHPDLQVEEGQEEVEWHRPGSDGDKRKVARMIPYA